MIKGGLPTLLRHLHKPEMAQNVVGLGLAHYLRKDYLKSFLFLVRDSALWLKLSSPVPAENIYEIGVINFRAYFTNSLTFKSLLLILIEVWWFSSQWQLMILFNAQKWRTNYLWQKYWIFLKGFLFGVISILLSSQYLFLKICGGFRLQQQQLWWLAGGSSKIKIKS